MRTIALPNSNSRLEMAGKFTSVPRFEFGWDIDNAVIRLTYELHLMINHEFHPMTASKKILSIRIE